MPCACKTPEQNTLDDSKEWGPTFWQFLHGLAEKIGTLVSPLYAPDELKLWPQLLQMIELVLPCEECRKHCKVWVQDHPLTPMQTLTNADLKVWVKTWLWTLHSDVDFRLEKPTVTYDELEGLYSRIPLEKQYRQMDDIQKKTISYSGLKPSDWMKFVKYYRMLTSIYGL
jgi:hypothetical protein